MRKWKWGWLVVAGLVTSTFGPADTGAQPRNAGLSSRATTPAEAAELLSLDKRAADSAAAPLLRMAPARVAQLAKASPGAVSGTVELTPRRPYVDDTTHLWVVHPNHYFSKANMVEMPGGGTVALYFRAQGDHKHVVECTVAPIAGYTTFRAQGSGLTYSVSSEKETTLVYLHDATGKLTMPHSVMLRSDRGWRFRGCAITTFKAG